MGRKGDFAETYMILGCEAFLCGEGIGGRNNGRLLILASSYMLGYLRVDIEGSKYFVGVEVASGDPASCSGQDHEMPSSY